MLKTNVESIVKMKLRAEVIHPELWVERGYATTWDGRPKLTVGIGGIVHNVRTGDPAFGWHASRRPSIARRASGSNQASRATAGTKSS